MLLTGLIFSVRHHQWGFFILPVWLSCIQVGSTARFVSKLGMNDAQWIIVIYMNIQMRTIHLVIIFGPPQFFCYLACLGLSYLLTYITPVSWHNLRFNTYLTVICCLIEIQMWGLLKLLDFEGHKSSDLYGLMGLHENKSLATYMEALG